MCMSSQPTPSALDPIPGAIVVGASSGIAAALARELARAGYCVALVARRADLLESERAAIESAAGPGRARSYVHDVTQYDEVPALFQRILRDLSRLDVIVYAAGTMAKVDLQEYDFA